MNKIKDNKSIYVVFFMLIVFTIGLFYFFVFKIKISEIIQLQNELSKNEKVMNRLENNYQNRDAIQKQIKEAENKNKGIKESIVYQNELPFKIIEISKILDLNKLAENRFVIGDFSKNTGGEDVILNLPISIGFKGNFDDVIHFIETLGTKKYIHINKLTISSKDTSEVDTVTSTIEILICFIEKENQFSKTEEDFNHANKVNNPFYYEEMWK